MLLWMLNVNYEKIKLEFKLQFTSHAIVAHDLVHGHQNVEESYVKSKLGTHTSWLGFINPLCFTLGPQKSPFVSRKK